MRNLTRSIPNGGLLCSLLLFSASLLQAKTVKVQCGGSKTDPTTISAALKLLNPNVHNTLNIFGACNENVVINGFNRLTLAGKQGEPPSPMLPVGKFRRSWLWIQPMLSFRSSRSMAGWWVCNATASVFAVSVGTRF